MRHLDPNQIDLGAESQEEAEASVEALTRKATQLKWKMEMPDRTADQKMDLTLELARTQLQLEDREIAWETLFPLLSNRLAQQDWPTAITICDLLYRCDRPDSLAALGHALWLSITFPVDPTLTVSQLQHVIDDTPTDSDGAAVAAAVAVYVVQLRSHQNNNSETILTANRLLSDVARRHGHVHSQNDLEQWITKLELDKPERFLVRMRNVIDVLVQDQWWIDREALQAHLPN